MIRQPLLTLILTLIVGFSAHRVGYAQPVGLLGGGGAHAGILAHRDRLMKEYRDAERTDERTSGVTTLARVLSVEELLFGKTDEQLVETLRLIAQEEEARGRHDAAERVLERVLAIRRLVDGENHWRVADAQWAIKDVRIRRGWTPRDWERWNQGQAAQARRMEHRGQGRIAEAIEDAEQVVQIREALLPTPHPHLANSHVWLGYLLKEQGEYEEALHHYRRGLALFQKVYPPQEWPDGHPDLARCLFNLGGLFDSMGLFAHAHAHLLNALTIREKLYPLEHFPEGHPDLAQSLTSVANVLRAMGRYEQALSYAKRALAMFQKLYPSRRFRMGHPDLAISFDNVGSLYGLLGVHKQAIYHCVSAHAMFERLYRQNPNTETTAQWAQSFFSLGYVLKSMGRYQEALWRFEKGRDLLEELYPSKDWPDGHPHLARCYNTLSNLLTALNRHEEALELQQKALAIDKKVYSPERFPDGHLHLAQSHYNLGAGYTWTRQYDQTRSHFERALEIQNLLLTRIAVNSSLNDGLQLLRSLPETPANYLELTRRQPVDPSTVYAHVWGSKALLGRLLLDRQRQARLLASAPGVAGDAIRQLRAARQQLDWVIRHPNTPNRDQKIRNLTSTMNDLQRKVANLGAQWQPKQIPQPEELTTLLHKGEVFIDLMRYLNRYVAFILSPDGSIKRVELGEVPPIDRTVSAWRTATSDSTPSLARSEENLRLHAQRLRRQLWDPIAAHLPPTTTTVYLSPDGALTRVPFHALPGDSPDTILLEQYAFAVIPNGLFLLGQRREQPQKQEEAGRILVMGGVHDDLPASRIEARQVTALAGQRPVVRLGKDDGTSERLLAELTQVEMAHLATHGVFDKEGYIQEQQRLKLSSNPGQLGERAHPFTLDARRPLSFVGLKCAEAEKNAKMDDPILSGAVIQDVDLTRMRLAVLSACETGLGEQTAGVGMENLQLAFHVAGCRSVIASLWKVDDDATAALMAKFYHELWVKKKPPIEALRQAQLTIYHHPDRINTLARERGIKFDKVAQLPVRKDKQTIKAKGKTHPKLWAAFVLSGVGK